MFKVWADVETYNPVWGIHSLLGRCFMYKYLCAGDSKRSTFEIKVAKYAGMGGGIWLES